MHSPPHRENILRGEFTEIGVGLAPGAPATPHSKDPPWTYTTDFGGPPSPVGTHGPVLARSPIGLRSSRHGPVRP